jgi:catechol 2,3-dioxygenase-like lactoylglutathione lyase family enzyme
MPAHCIDHVNIRANPALIAEMKAFYEQVLGASDGWRPPFKSTGHWLYLDGKPVVHLVEDASIQMPTGSRGPIVDHVAFACTEPAGFEARLQAAGVAFRRTEVPGTRLMQFFCTDPAGNGVELQFEGGQG